MTRRLSSPDVDVVFGDKIQDVYVKISPEIDLIYQADCLQWIVRQTAKGVHISQSTFTQVSDALRWTNILLEECNENRNKE